MCDIPYRTDDNIKKRSFQISWSSAVRPKRVFSSQLYFPIAVKSDIYVVWKGGSLIRQIREGNCGEKKKCTWAERQQWFDSIFTHWTHTQSNATQLLMQTGSADFDMPPPIAGMWLGFFQARPEYHFCSFVLKSGDWMLEHFQHL